MMIRLRKNATTTPAIRAYIQALPLSVAALANGVSEDTVRCWKNRDSVEDRPPTAHRLQTTLTPAQEAVVIADEAHRSLYGFKAKVDAKTGEVSYGFAKYLRNALPNASFIGFTGTPIEKEDINTPAVFGHYFPRDREQTGIDEAEAVAVLLEKLYIVRAMFHGFDVAAALEVDAPQRLARLAAAIDWILARQHEWAARETTPEGKKAAQRRFADGQKTAAPSR